MPKQFLKGLAVIMFIGFVAGCASSKADTAGAISTRAYVADQDRVDQEMQGNFGYLSGAPQAPDRSKFKKTRKVYVLEVTKEPAEAGETTTAEAAPVEKTYEAPVEEERPSGRTIDLPDFEEPSSRQEVTQTQESPAAGLGGGQEYTIEKDDTLQKISKKFYNTYSKWPKIYEANKNVLTNPNKIKPGIKIQIPEL